MRAGRDSCAAAAFSVRGAGCFLAEQVQPPVTAQPLGAENIEPAHARFFEDLMRESTMQLVSPARKTPEHGILRTDGRGCVVEFTISLYSVSVKSQFSLADVIGISRRKMIPGR